MKTFIAIIVLATATTANAQTATTTTASAPTTTPTCEIVKILQGGVIDVGKEPTSIIIKTKGCEEIKEVVANELEFTELQFKGNRLTAKVKATNQASAGTVSLKIKDKDDNETESPDSVYILVLGPADIHVRAIADKAMAANALTSKKVKALESRVETVSVTRPTRDEVTTAIAPLQRKIADLEKVVISLNEEVGNANNRIAALGIATTTLADGQVSLGKTEVKKGFWGGKKPLNPKVAEAAEQIRDAFAPAPTTVTTNNK